MNYKITTGYGCAQINLSGRFSYSDYEAFRGLLRGIIEEHSRTKFSECIIDLGGLEFADSTALGMLVLINDAALRERFSLRLRNARGQVRSLLQRAEFSILVTVE